MWSKQEGREGRWVGDGQRVVKNPIWGGFFWLLRYERATAYKDLVLSIHPVFLSISMNSDSLVSHFIHSSRHLSHLSINFFSIQRKIKWMQHGFLALCGRITIKKKIIIRVMKYEGFDKRM